MMSTSLGRALRTVLTLACALAALAVVAGPAAASELLPETGEEPELIVLGHDFDVDDNAYAIDMGGQLTVTLGIAGRRFEPFVEVLPAEVQETLCTFPEFAGIYGVIGLLTEPWRPSRRADPDNRRAGLSVWANELGTATVPISRDGCEGPTMVFPGQVRLDIDPDEEPFSGSFLTETRLSFCQEGGDYVLTGSAIGAGGRPVTYLIPSTSGVWHFYTLGAFGTEQPSNEEVVNLRFDGFPRESVACADLLRR